MNSANASKVRRAVRTAEQMPEDVEDRRVFDSATAVPLFGRVTGATSISANRWSYTVQPVRYFAGWVDDGAPLTGVLNTIEWHNSSGECGNGVNASFLCGNWQIKPASTGTPIVRLYKVGEQWLFSLANGVDGSCD